MLPAQNAAIPLPTSTPKPLIAEMRDVLLLVINYTNNPKRYLADNLLEGTDVSGKITTKERLKLLKS